MGRSAYFPEGGVRMGADRRGALLDFLLEAVADEGTTPFPANVLASLRRVVRCEAVSYFEWSPQELLEFSLAADAPESILPVWRVYPQVRHDDPLPGGASHGSPLPNREWLGRTLAISDFINDREFYGGGLYAEVCKPLGVRAVMKVFLPTGGATGASFVFDTTRSRFTETDRLTLQRVVSHMGQLRRNTRAEDLSGAGGFHRSGPDEATAPHATRTGRPRPSRGRRNEHRDRTGAFRQPRDRPQAS
jgi:hypothetical protein